MATKNSTPDYLVLPLSKGYFTFISEVDADLAEVKWTADERRDGICYAHRRGLAGKEYLHRVVLERVLERGLVNGERPDHQNRCGLDNRRENLRLATFTENNRNSKVRKHSQAGYKGVQENCGVSWGARIRVDGQIVKLGYFSTPEDAAIAYNHAAAKHFGEFAVFNQIPGWQDITPVPRIQYKELRRDNKSGYPGVSFYARRKKWVARITVNGKRHELGFYDSAELAHQARQRALAEIRT